MLNKNFFLIGLPCVGKTTLGEKLAKALKLNFIDADQEIIKSVGASISLIFDLEGEAGFRKRETEILKNITLLDNIVLSTGGGVVLDSYNRKILKERGIVIYLNADPIFLSKRIENNNNKRPLLKSTNIEAKYISLYEQRNSLYKNIADLEIIIDSDVINNTFNILLSQIKEKYY